ncbi:MAG: CBS domain-containing protein, partial [Candidatus Lokiarchaeota archaeon]|nr:CBS domain-containing protein [Candidatus Lokiarchaeota archaeon]
CDIKVVAEKIIEENTNHIVIIDKEHQLIGIVTSFDITKAIARDKSHIKDIITKKVITATDNEPIEVAARRMKMNNISALPIINDEKKCIGIITSEELM